LSALGNAGILSTLGSTPFSQTSTRSVLSSGSASILTSGP